MYLINRQPLAVHLALLERFGMRVIDSHLFRRVDGLLKDSFKPGFADMSDLNASTHMAFLVCSRAEIPAAFGVNRRRIGTPASNARKAIAIVADTLAGRDEND
jgi:hypothetical protein